MVKTIEDYLDFLEEEYPDIPRKTLLKIVKKGLGNLQELIYGDYDVRIWDKTQGREYHMGFVRSVSDDKVRLKRAYVNHHRLLKKRSEREKL